MLTGSKRKAMKMPGPRKTKPRKAKCTHPLVRTTWGLRHDSEGRIAPDVALAAHCVSGCNERLSLGPSNDDIPLSEIVVASCAHSDADLDRYDNEGAFDWDVTRPLAEQWPWSGHETREAFFAHMARGDAMLDELIGPAEPVLTDSEVATIIAQSSDSYVPYDLDSVRTAIQDLKSCGALTSRPIEGVSVPARETAPDAFSPSDTASREPWQTTQETQSTGELETQLRAAADEFMDGIGTVVPEGVA